MAGTGLVNERHYAARQALQSINSLVLIHSLIHSFAPSVNDDLSREQGAAEHETQNVSAAGEIGDAGDILQIHRR